VPQCYELGHPIQFTYTYTYTYTMTHYPPPNTNTNILNQPISVTLTSTHHPKIRDYYSPRIRSGLTFTGPSRTKQQFAAECDINNIMRRYLKTGILDHVRDGAPQYLDATALEFQSAMELVAQAQTIFEELPSAIRARFENDPSRLLEFVHDPANIAESVAMGFLDPAKLPSGGVSQNAATPPSAAEGGKGAKAPQEGGA